jgi:peroxiredoxin
VPPATGAPAPAFALPSAAGGAVSLEALLEGAASGSALLAFFKVGCPTCAIAFPLLASLARHVEPAVAVLAVGEGRTAANGEWLREHDYDGAAASDAYGNHRVARAYRVQTIPTLVLVGRDGKVAFTLEGWDRDRYNELTARVAALAGIATTPLVSPPTDGRPQTKAGCWARSRR